MPSLQHSLCEGRKQDLAERIGNFYRRQQESAQPAAAESTASVSDESTDAAEMPGDQGSAGQIVDESKGEAQSEDEGNGTLASGAEPADALQSADEGEEAAQVDEEGEYARDDGASTQQAAEAVLHESAADPEAVGVR